MHGLSAICDIRSIIESARSFVAQTVNSSLVMLYWQIGKRIKQDVLRNKRAGYGERIVATLSRQLTGDYGHSFSEKNLRRMIQFFEVFSDEKIVVSLIRQLTWTHFIALIPLEDPLQRDFYAEMCRLERWNVRTLRKKIDGMLYERTALSKKPKQLVHQELSLLRNEDKLTPDIVFRDPYFLDFLGLKDTYSEKDIEAAILREMEAFILELGVGFTFLARQKRITIDHKDYYLDLLFYHRKLHRLIAIELKLGQFQAQDKGQMELYLKLLVKHEQDADEQSPIGLILCAGKSTEHIELLELEKSGIRVAEYLTKLLPRKVLEQKLHKAIQIARKQLEDSRIEDKS